MDFRNLNIPKGLKVLKKRKMREALPAGSASLILTYLLNNHLPASKHIPRNPDEFEDFCYRKTPDDTHEQG